MIEKIFLLVLLLPLGWMFILGMTFFFRYKIHERVLSECVKWLSLVMVASCLFLIGHVAFLGEAVKLNYPAWIDLGQYAFKLRFQVDLLGTVYATLSSALIGIIFRFSRNYLHKEEGYFRFVFLLSTLLFGLMLVCFARSLDIIFAGWELVGTTSVLLISYFYMQSQPVRHSLKAIISYRLCDMGLLAAAAWGHHYLHSHDWTEMAQLVTGNHHAGPFIYGLIGGFIVWAALAKSGQLPFSSWLPAAMEGPTPSSAIFYGALSVHLGPFLLLRFYDYLSLFTPILWIIGVIGASSAVYATMVSRTRSDAKTMLAYATISQVGLIWVEIALGWTNFAIFHLVAHACLRTWQYLRSASLIQEFVENPLVTVDRGIPRQLIFERLFSLDKRKRIYIHALHGFHLDALNSEIIRYLLLPFHRLIQLETKLMEFNHKMIKKLFFKRDY